ncbi:NAD(P)-dependent malic enzyme [Aminipila luticellarii]|uniref:NAD-dependent malic enzyme n=1 Tax=Aminipila luticellarii TaxID=2507160 RepID=A0A410PVK5_9FIRM|nr:malic enzyme-like NAD(P)-binding protein [Aminipila luticellarii]QAT42967.1 NAD-dependent malic enzyme [Aminipila luticellarii]
MDNREYALKAHKEWGGKIEVIARSKIKTKEDLAVAYTPGVAVPCLEIEKDENKAYDYTRKSNLVAVITNGTAVLGLGDIGPSAGMPVMEGKCVLFKEFGGVDAFPLCVDTKDVDDLVNVIYKISKSFGGINLEDIGAPACFEVERRLKEMCDIPVFHDDQHGTAIVVTAALINAAKLKGQKPEELKIVMNGAGAAGISITKLLLDAGFKDIVVCDSKGILCEGVTTAEGAKGEIARMTNREKKTGSLADAMKGSDIFVGVSKGNLVSEEMVQSMNEKPIILAMANPTPEIMPDKALHAGAYIVGTGRSDFPNQINNVLVFPGVFKGALAVRATEITDSMKMAAAKAIASVVSEGELKPEYIIPDPFNPRVAQVVADAVAAEAKRIGINRI